MKNGPTRRSVLKYAGLATAACALPGCRRIAVTPGGPPVKLGLASYTFRNFNRSQMIGFMKQLKVAQLNAKDVKDHLPMDPTEEAAALADYSFAGIHLHAAGAIYFPKDEDADIRSKFEYCKRAGISVIVAGDPTPDSIGDPQSWPGRQALALSAGRDEGGGAYGSAHRLLHRRRTLRADRYERG